MKITYANHKVEEYFTNYQLMKRKLTNEWTIMIRKHMRKLEEATNFQDVLTIRYGKLERLVGFTEPTYSIRVNKNVRLIFMLGNEWENPLKCTEIEIKGVCDYHGRKENWFIA